MASVPRIGIDAMGGDFGPSVVAEGTALAFKEMPGQFEIVLVGDEAEIGHSLKRVHANGYPIEVVHAAERIEMSEKAVMAARKNKSSLGVLTQLHKERRIDAMFSAGNTGAVVMTTLLGLGRLEAVSPPALAAFLPNPGGGTVVLDVGANSEVKASYLVQFAHMGAVYARYLLGRDNPRVGLLSIGAEATKGNALVFEALPLLRRARHLNFIGNVEGRDVFKGTCDVVVTDGFTGNVVLKTAESVAGLLAHMVREELHRDWLARARALLMLPSLQRGQQRIEREGKRPAPPLRLQRGGFIRPLRNRGTALPR